MTSALSLIIIRWFFLLATQGMFDWVDILEGKLDSMSPVGTDLETVKQQIVELKVKSAVWFLMKQSCLVYDVCAVAECHRSFQISYQLFLCISCANKRETAFVFAAQ